MPYHTRIRSNTDPASPSQLPPQKLNLQQQQQHQQQHQQLPAFPLLGLPLHPEDDSSKVFHAIATSLLAVGNRAMTIKDLAHRSLKHGLVCTDSSPINAASQQITTYIRLHQRRCEMGESKPLLKSFVLNGTSDDDRLTGALYSRAGGTATRKGGAVDTAFRKGTLVWYLNPDCGAPDPFQQAGVTIPGTKKRRRLVKPPALSSDSEEEKRPKIKLKIKLGSLSVVRPPSSTTGASESNPITLLSPDSSMSSLGLPPYPIQSHCRHLFNIPNSPYDLPEFASPPPDSEDDFDDFHMSMMAAMDDSDSELPPASVKDESDTDVEEGSSGRRSRSTSWTTVADPKTPRDVDKPLIQPACKVEGEDDVTVNASLSVNWDDSHHHISDISVKRENGTLFSTDAWMSQHDTQRLVSFDEPFLLQSNPQFPLISKLEGPSDGVIAGPEMHHTRNRSFSAPVTWRSTDSKPANSDEDDVEILGPDSVPPEEFDECLWTCRNVKSATADSVLPNSEPVAGQGTSSTHGQVGNCYFTRNGIEVCEVQISGHTLRKRLDNSTIHLTSLLRLLSSEPPSGDFMQLDGASVVEEGDLKGTWVPLTFAQSLIEGRDCSSQLADFLEAPLRANDEESNEPPSSLDLSELPDIVPESKPPPPTPKVGVDWSPNNRFPYKLPLRHLPVTLDEDVIWQRDDWKAKLDLDSSLSFPRLPMFRTSTHAEQLALHNNDSPLSPQEEEIFHSLVDLGMGKFPEPDHTVEHEESVLEADDERDSPKQLRRSKRVAARSDSTKTRTPLTGARRSVRTK